MKKTNKIYFLIIAMLLCTIIVKFSFYCYSASIHGDEYFSIGFANNARDFLFLTRSVINEYGTNKWIDGDFLHDWLSVQPGEQFAIMQIHRNVRHDVHPPLYFMLLNVISSFFVDEVTLIPGYFINVCAGVLICILLFLISRKIFKNKWMACVPSLFWAASNAASISMTYLRMYAPLCALCLICLYLHLLYFEKEKVSKWIYVLFGIITTIGTLTHYYYYVFQFVLLWVVIAISLYHKQITKLVFYGVSLLVGEFISFSAYPYVIKHLLYSERGMQAQENLGNFNFEYYVDFFKQFLNTINFYVYSNKFRYVFAALIAVVIVALGCYIMRKYNIIPLGQKESIWIERGKCNFFIVCIVMVGYFLILFKISYSANWIYISPIFPLLAIISSGVFAILSNNISKRTYAYMLFVICLYGTCGHLISMTKWNVSTHDNIEKRHDIITEEAANLDVIFLYDDWNNLYDNQILELMEFNQIRAIGIEEIHDVNYAEIMSSRKKENDLVIYIPTKVEAYQEKAETVASYVGGTIVKTVMEDTHGIYRVEMGGENESNIKRSYSS